MDQAQANPHRNRRRLFLVIVLLLASIAAWSAWPRPSLDRRFVGTWEWIDGDSVKVVRLTGNGELHFVSFEASPTRWGINKNHLIIGDDAPYVGFKERIQRIAPWIVDVVGKPVMVQSVDELEIGRISDSEIEIEPRVGDEMARLRRLAQ